jgi:hypothetical protein
MVRIIDLMKTAVLASLLLVSSVSFACKPLVHQVSEYVQGKIPNAVIFVGKVISVEKVHEIKGEILYEITFTPSRWVKGESRPTVIVRGITGSGSGSCKGEWDFFANVGEQWLVFGQAMEKGVNPDAFLSSQIIGGQVQPRLQEELKRNGISSQSP